MRALLRVPDVDIGFQGEVTIGLVEDVHNHLNDRPGRMVI